MKILECQRPLDEAAERALCLAAVEEDWYPATEIAATIESKRAQARAEGYAQAMAEADRLEAMANELKAQLKAAQQEIARRIDWADRANAAEEKLRAAQQEIERCNATIIELTKLGHSAETKLSVAQAEIEMYQKQHQEDHIASDLSIRRAIERSLAREARGMNEYTTACAALNECRAQLSAAQAEIESLRALHAGAEKRASKYAKEADALETKLEKLRTAAERADLDGRLEYWSPEDRAGFRTAIEASR